MEIFDHYSRPLFVAKGKDNRNSLSSAFKTTYRNPSSFKENKKPSNFPVVILICLPHLVIRAAKPIPIFILVYLAKPTLIPPHSRSSRVSTKNWETKTLVLVEICMGSAGIVFPLPANTHTAQRKCGAHHLDCHRAAYIFDRHLFLRERAK